MKSKCTEPGCGTVIQMADDQKDKLAIRMAEHMQREHGSVELKHAKTLEACRSAFFVLLSGGKITPKQARQLHDQVSDLLSKPHVAIQGEKPDASISGSTGSETISAVENAVPAELAGDGLPPAV